MDSHFSSMLSMLLCLETHNIILLRTCFGFPWSGSWISKDSQSIVNVHVLQARIEELVNTYPNSFFIILSCKAMNIVLNNVHIAPFINSLANSGGLYGIFGLSLTLSWRRPLSYRNQSIYLRSKSMDWFLYDNGLLHERVKRKLTKYINEFD